MKDKMVNVVKYSRVSNWFSKLIDDELYLKIIYRVKMGKKLDLNNPQTFNEKLQWLKLHDRKDIYTTLVDKYDVKKYVADIIGEEHIIPTIGVYDKFDDIDFDKLPKQFVMKCTHDSGGLVICEDKEKLDMKETRKKISECLGRNFYYLGREWPYKNVKPRIIIEKYMKDEKDGELRDYKFFVFNGEVKFFKVDFDRFIDHRANYYDVNGELLRFGEIVCPPDFERNIEIPKNYKKMIALAKKIAGQEPFARIDFYDINGVIYFGEITFYPASGLGKFSPDEWDRKLGKMLDLKKVGRDGR